MKLELCDLCGKDVSKARDEIHQEADGFRGCIGLFNKGYHLEGTELKDRACYHAYQSGTTSYEKAIWISLNTETSEGVSLCMRCQHGIFKKVMKLWMTEAQKECKCSLNVK